MRKRGQGRIQAKLKKKLEGKVIKVGKEEMKLLSQVMTLTILQEVFGVWYWTKDVPLIGGSDKWVGNRIYDRVAGVSPCGALNSKGITDSHNTCSWLSQNP